MDLVTFLALSLATYRLATDLAWEDGPADAYSRLRGAVIQTYGGDSWPAAGVTCPICLSFWISLPLTVFALMLGAGDPWLWPLWWLGVAGAAAGLARAR